MSSDSPVQTDRPNIPYDLLDATEGAGLLAWDELCAKMRDALCYWIGTTCPDGRPHVVPVWGVWLDETFYFSSGPSVNGRNLKANPSVVVHLESGEDAVIFEGVVEDVGADATLIGRINDLYGPKYDWAERMPSFYALRPHVAFYWACRGGGPSSEADYKGSATRWRFRHD